MRADPDALPRMNLAGLRALIVDDNTSSREILQQHLTSWVSRLFPLKRAPRLWPRWRPSERASTSACWTIICRVRTESSWRGSSGRMPLVATSARAAEFTGRPRAGSEASRLFAAILTKPLRRAQLFSCVSRVMTKQPGVAADAPVSRPARRLRTGRRPRILLVEDNAVNREVAVGMLENLGCSRAAENGWLAIEAMNAAAYDAVLMDCQMPVMDGLTATAEITPARADTRAARACPSSR